MVALDAKQILGKSLPEVRESKIPVLSNIAAMTSILQRPVTTARDYGNPRYGANTFDFIAQRLSILPLKACVTVQGANGPERECQ